MILTADEFVDIRAAQRTFEGAYIRTALGQFTIALVVLRYFSQDFYHIGSLFAAHGFMILIVSFLRRHTNNKQFFSQDENRTLTNGSNIKFFQTSGNVVLILSSVSFIAYAGLIALTMKLSD